MLLLLGVWRSSQRFVNAWRTTTEFYHFFYQVEPTDVRYQKKTFEEAFTRHENSGRHEPEKVQQWRDALNKVASLSGWHTEAYKTDRQLLDDIVEYLCTRVQPTEIKMGDFEAFEATRRAIDKVMKALEDDTVTAIGVYGIGGVGKTTLVKYVSAQARKNGIFDYVIMAIVSQTPDLRKIQGTLADLLGINLVEETEIGRASRLNKEIMRRNKTLIILDDIWDMIDLSTVGIPNYKELQHCMSKVLLTTRIMHVCHSMRCQEKISLDILSKDDSWTLFVRNAGRSFESTEFVGVARRVAGECCGLPIALIAVAKALGDKELVEWKKAAVRLEKSQTANLDDRGEAFKCIKLSYEYLKDEDSRSCFLLCCLFPEDYDIRIEDLFKYAVGKGLFWDADTIEEARGTAVSVVKHLRNSSLLLDSEEKGCVRMHDVIRDTAIEIAWLEDADGYFVKAGCGLKDWPSRFYEGGYSAASLMKNNIRKLPEQLICPKLQILLLPKNVSLEVIPETFFESLKDIRVLDLSRNRISFLPQSFSILTNLQALYLDFCRKRLDTSMLGKFKKLQILSMREYPNERLSAEIGQLTNLRMLDISGANNLGGIVTIPSKVISKLHRLEELYMLYCGFENWGSNVEKEGEETNICFAESVGLSNLRIVQVTIADAKCIPKKVEVQPNWVYFDIRIGGRTGRLYGQEEHDSRFLRLEDTTIGTLPDWFVKAVTEKTETLEYDSCKGLTNILMEYDHGRLYGLKQLYVGRHRDGYDENLVELMSSTTRVKTGPVFKNLERLNLSNLDYLKELCVSELPPDSLLNLKLLYVKSCSNLENVSKLVQRLPTVENLYLNRSGKVEYVFETQGCEPEQSRLRAMYLLGLEALRSICSGPVQHPIFQRLEILVVYDCNSLRSLFTSDVAECLFQLEYLFVDTCLMLEGVIEARNEPAKNKKIKLPKLKNLILKQLPVLCSLSATIDVECPSLEHLYIVDCPLYLFPTSAPPQFHSKNQVQLNDEEQYRFISSRFSRFVPCTDQVKNHPNMVKHREEHGKYTSSI